MYKTKDLKNGVTLVSAELIEELDMDFMGEYKDELNYIINDYNHYLIFAYNCSWNGASGYKITDNKDDAFIRSYDYTQELVGVSRGNKACLLREYHHDVPTGHYVVIVGLTDKDYNIIFNYDFEQIKRYADKYKNMIGGKK